MEKAKTRGTFGTGRRRRLRRRVEDGELAAGAARFEVLGDHRGLVALGQLLVLRLLQLVGLLERRQLLLDDRRLVDARLVGGELLGQATLDSLQLADARPQPIAVAGQLGDGLLGLLRRPLDGRSLRPGLRLIDAGRRQLRLEPLDLGVLRGVGALGVGQLPLERHDALLRP